MEYIQHPMQPILPLAASSLSSSPFFFPSFVDPVYNGSVGETPHHLADAFSMWGSTSTLIIGVVYLVSLCYIVMDYFDILSEQRKQKDQEEEGVRHKRPECRDAPVACEQRKKHGVGLTEGSTVAPAHGTHNAPLTLEEEFLRIRRSAQKKAQLLSTGQDGREDEAENPMPSSSTSSSLLGNYTLETLNNAHAVKHMAVIMDGNRRFGKMRAKELSATDAQATADAAPSPPAFVPTATEGSFITNSRLYKTSIALLKSLSIQRCGEKLIGHKAGGEKLLDFAKYCIRFNIPILTVYAFSTENWNRPQEEIDILMALFTYFFEHMREEAHRHGIYCRFIVGDGSRLNPELVALMRAIERDTRAIRNRRITVNVCVSYGSRLEIVNACQSIADEALSLQASAGGVASAHHQPLVVTEKMISDKLMTSLTESDLYVDDSKEDGDGATTSQEEDAESTIGAADCPPQWRLTREEKQREIEANTFIRANDPDVLFRSSGEQRLSNFLLYQCAYSEMFFTDKAWPSVGESDVEALLVEYCCRHRRFGK